MKTTLLLVSCCVLLAVGFVPASAVELADASCYECHDELKAAFAEGTVHEPIVDGDCESCHEDHGDDYGLVLADEVPALCFNCHDEPARPTVHEPVADGSCLDCHQVHNAPAGSLLTAEVPDLCSDCHDPVEEPTAPGSAHEPVADGSCLDCHNAHESAQARLLEGGYSLDRYAAFSPDNYGLCFNCHDQEAFETEEAGDFTAFANGTTNLHFLHVVGKEEVNKYGIKKQKDGMTCFGCHMGHGAPQPRMVRPTLECGATYCYTINFRVFDGGGACVVGCHKPKVYKVQGTREAEVASKDAGAPAVP